MMTGAIGRLLRFAAVLALAGVTVGCASSQGPQTGMTAPAGYGKDTTSRAERLVQYCDRLVEKGELVTALGLCARAHEVNPDDPEPLMKVAAILKMMNRREAAAETYGALLERHPGHQEARYNLGKVYMESGQSALASIQFNHAMRSNPEDPRTYNALGILRDQEGEHEAAQGLYRLALERDPDNTSVRNNLGLSLALDGKRDEAIDVLAELAVDPAANQTMLRNLEAAYAARAVPQGAAQPAAGPAAVPAATGPAPTPVRAMSVPIEPVEALPMDEPAETPRHVKQTPAKTPVRIPMVKGPKPAPQTPEAGKPTPLFMPPGGKSDGKRPQQSGQRRVAPSSLAPNAVLPSPASSVILAAAERLMQPPEWADFEPGALIDDTPAVPAPAAQPQNGSLGESDVIDLSFFEPHEKRPAPYALSMLLLDSLESNV